MKLPTPNKRKLRAFKTTIVTFIIISITLMWMWNIVISFISAAMTSPLTLRVLVTTLGTLLILTIAVPMIAVAVRKYIKALREDIKSLKSDLQRWSQEREFIKLSREALQMQIEAMGEETHE